MLNEEIIEGNKLIAEFMGLHFHKVGWVDNTYIDGNYECEELKYSYSWDWLMPVVEKIRLISNRFVFVQGKTSTILRSSEGTGKIDFESTQPETTINSAWLAVVEFIKYLNI